MCLYIFFWFSWEFWLKVWPIYVQMLLLSCWIMILLLLLILLLVLSLPLVRYCCTLFSFCHFYYSFLILVCYIIWFLTYPSFTSLIHPRCDKFYFLSNFNSSLMLEFNDSLFLLLFLISQKLNLKTKVFPSFFTYLQLICMEIPSFNFEILYTCLVKILILGIPFFYFLNPTWAPMLCMAVLYDS